MARRCIRKNISGTFRADQDRELWEAVVRAAVDSNGLQTMDYKKET